MYTQISKRDMFVSVFALMIVGGLLYHGIQVMATQKGRTATTLFYR